MPIPIRFLTAAVCAAMAFSACIAAIADQHASDVIANPGFEGPYASVSPVTGKSQIAGITANGWSDDSAWAAVNVTYAEEDKDVHGGGSAQKITVAQIHSGRAQLVQHIQLIPDHFYLFSVWMKGLAGAQATIAIRQGPSPYVTYGQNRVSLDGSWQKVTVDGKPSGNTDDVLMIFPPTGSSLLVDDASLKDATANPSDAPAKIGSLIPDGSFEAGFGGGWNSSCFLGSDFENVDPRPQIDSTTSADGKNSVKITLPCARTVTFCSPLVEYNYGRIHTAVVWMKSDIDRTFAVMMLPGASSKQSLYLTKSWQKVTITSILSYGHSYGYAGVTRLILSFSLPSAGSVWIDGVGLYEGDPPASTIPAPELVLGVDRPGGVFFDGERAVVHTSVANAPAGSTTRATCLDLYGKTITLPAVSATATSLTVPIDAAHPRGVFKVTAQVFGPDNRPVTLPIQQVFARLPKPLDIVPEQSYFGIHIPLAPEYFAIARAIGARWCRLHDATMATKWPIVEPSRGKFTFQDAGVDGARAAGLAILGMLDGGPEWVSTKPRPANDYYERNYNVVDAPNAIDEWKIYVDKTVSHYKGTIDNWEVWNEPWGDQFTPGSPEIYGNLLKAAYPVAKQVNPAATIIGINTSVGFDPFTDSALKTAGGSSSYDAFSFHDYYVGLSGGPNSGAAQQATLFNNFETKYGHTTPHWMTEGAPALGAQSMYFPIGSELGARFQYSQAVRYDVTQIGAGVRHIFYYTLHGDVPYGTAGRFCSALEHDRTIRPILAARAVLASLIDGAPCSGRTEPVPGVDCYKFSRSIGGQVEVVWSYDAGSHLMPVAIGSHVLDALGNPLPADGNVQVGQEPIYVLTN